MFTRLNAVGVVKYNGYQLPPTFKAKVSARNVYDLANRAVKYVSYTFNIEWYVTGGDPPTFLEGGFTDQNLEKLRKCLMEPGGEFHFEAQGFGNYSANFGGVYDVANGPTPLDFSWEPIGSSHAGLVRWSVEVHLPECCSVTPPTTGQLMEWTFEVNYSTNAAGMSVRAVTGTLEIPMTRRGQAIPDIVDAYRERINLLVPHGFKRESNFHVSRDKRILDFTIIDSEIESNNAYPVGVVDCDVRYSVNQVFTTAGHLADVAMGSLLSWGVNKLVGILPIVGGLYDALRSVPVGLPIYVASMAGTYRVLEGEPFTRAYDAFKAIVADRKAQATLGKILRDLGFTTTAALPKSFGFSEGLYDRTVTFNQEWYIPLEFSDIMKASGIWRKVPSQFNNGTNWQTSMSDAFGNRGLAGLRSLTSEDVIVSLCADGNPTMGGDCENRISTIVTSDPDKDADSPDKANWLGHSIKFNYIEGTRSIRHAFYDELPPSISNANPGNTSGAVGGFRFREPQRTHKDIIQMLGGASIAVVCSGGAVRVGKRIPAPVVRRVGNLPAVYMGGTHSCEAVSNVQTESGTQPIFAASWKQVYFLEDSPQGELGEPNNFIAGGGDTENATPVPIPWA